MAGKDKKNDSKDQVDECGSFKDKDKKCPPKPDDKSRKSSPGAGSAGSTKSSGEKRRRSKGGSSSRGAKILKSGKSSKGKSSRRSSRGSSKGKASRGKSTKGSSKGSSRGSSRKSSRGRSSGGKSTRGKPSKGKGSNQGPKRKGHPAPSFVLFFKETMEKRRCEGKRASTIMKECGKLWKKMSPEEKMKYIKEYCAVCKDCYSCKHNKNKK